MNVICLLCSLCFFAPIPQKTVNGIKYQSKPTESLNTIQTFRKGYQQGVDGLFYSAISTLQEIPKSSNLYPRAKKLISFYNKKVHAWKVEHDNRIKYANTKSSTYTYCVDPKYGCHGTDNCKKCTNCSRCRHCNDHNGSCGVCR